MSAYKTISSRSKYTLAIAAVSIGALFIAGLSGADSAPKSVGSDRLMTARSGSCAAMLPDGKILITGGEANKTMLASTELFSIRTGTVAGPAMSTARMNHVCAALPGGLVLAAGGSISGGGALNSAELYDPATAAFAPVASMMMARASATASALPDGRVLVAGGEIGGVPTNSLEMFGPATKTFHALSQGLLSRRSQHAAVTLKGGTVLIFGGWDGEKALDTIESYDPADDSVRVIGKMSMPRAGLSATVLLNGRVFLAGGSTNGKNEVASAEIFDPKDGSTKPAASMGAPRRGHLAVRLPENNGVLIIGGRGNGNLLAGAQLYIPWWDKYKPLAALKLPQTSPASSTVAFKMRTLFSDTVVKAASSDPSVFPILSTDKDDYSPDETATITGSGWPAGATVNLKLDRDPNHAGLTPVEWTVTADDSGTFSTTYVVVIGDLGETFTLTGYVGGTLETAQIVRTVTFTDGNVQVSGAEGVTFTVTVTKYTNSTACLGTPGNGDVKTITITGTTPVNAAGGQLGDSVRLEAASTATSGGGSFLNWTGPNSFTSDLKNICVATAQNDQLQYVAHYAKLDATSPTSNASVSPVPNAAGWNNSDPTISLSATDNTGGSGVKSITYSTGGANTEIAGANASFSITAEGETIVTYFATDNGGNVEVAHKLTVKLDKTAPTLTLPANITAEATGAGGAAVTYSATATDTLDSSPTVGCSPASGSTFTVGTTTVNCTATDTAGNQATGTFTVQVHDTTAPSVAVPPNITVEATGPSGAAVKFTASASDAVDGDITPVCSSASGSTFPLGATTVSCTATDKTNNTATRTFTVTVVDTTPPVFSPLANIVVEQTALGGNIVAYNPTATDLVDGSVPVTCVPGSGSIFPVGVNTVTCSARDARGNSASTSFTITVRDTIAPTGSIKINEDASYTNSTSVTVTLTCTDAGSGCATMQFSDDGATYKDSVAYASTSTYTFQGNDGPKTVYVKYTDAAGNLSAPISATIGLDTASPTSVLTFPGTGAYNADRWHNGATLCGINNSDPVTDFLCGTASDTGTGSSGAKTVEVSIRNSAGSYWDPTTNKFTASAEGFISATVGTASAGTIPWSVPFNAKNFADDGSYTVHVRSTDAAGNVETTVVTATFVIDTRPPTISATAKEANATDYTSGAWTKNDVTVTFACEDSGGSGLADGNPPSPVMVSKEGANQSASGTCTDKAGNSASATFSGINIDKTPPNVTVPDPITAEATGPTGAAVTYAAHATDTLDPTPKLTCSPASGSTFGLGETTVSCTATDHAGNTSAETILIVKVQDKTPPELHLPATIVQEQTAPDGTAITYDATATDLVDGSVRVTCSTVSGSVFPSGSTTVNCSATDAHGNKATGSFTVTVQDTTRPTIEAKATFVNGAPYNGTWTNQNVAVAFTCSDFGSGLAVGSPPSPVMVSAEGANQSASGTCTDKAGNSASATFNGINIDKTAPAAPVATITPAPNGAGWNTTPVTVSFACTDVFSGIQAYTLPSSITQEGASSVPGSCTDNAGNTGSATVVPVKIDKTNPTISNVVANPMAITLMGKLTATMTDPLGVSPVSGIASAQFKVDGDAYAAMTTIAGSAFGSATVNVTADLQPFATAGVHTVCVQATDVAGNTAAETCAYYAVYDPNGGFVTGGGWINSPAGAYTADPTLTGKANFGFVSKYKKGQSTPDGNTEFQFQAGNLNFHSTSYDWLVISGPKAQFKGTGTINGSGAYGFILTSIDGRLNGGGGTDKFRIKIQDKASGTVIYDNQSMASDTADPTTVLGGGSIQIQTK